MDAKMIIDNINVYANIIMALCAFFTVVYTIKNNYRLQDNAKKLEERKIIAVKYDEICFNRCIKAWDDFYKSVLENFHSIAECREAEDVKFYYENIDNDYKRFVAVLKSLEYFSKEKYEECDDLSINIPDYVAICIEKIEFRNGRIIGKYQITSCERKIMQVGKKITKILFEYGCDDIWRIDLRNMSNSK